MKHLRTEIEGSRKRRGYDDPQTSFERLKQCGHADAQQIRRLEKQKAALNPFELKGDREKVAADPATPRHAPLSSCRVTGGGQFAALPKGLPPVALRAHSGWPFGSEIHPLCGVLDYESTKSSFFVTRVSFSR